MKSLRFSLIVLVVFLFAACSDDSSPSKNNNQGDTGHDVTQPDSGPGGDDADSLEDAEEPGREEGARLRFDPASQEFFGLPIPSDARVLGADGFGFNQWQRAYGNSLLQLWLDAADDLMQGWGLVSGVFVNFDEPIDPSTLPQTIEETMRDSLSGAQTFPSVFLVDVDPDSPQQGRMLPIECKFTEAAGTYHDANLLGCVSPFGAVRLPETRYALVVTSGLKDAAGNAVVAAPAMQQLLAGQDVPGREGATISAAAYVAARDQLVAGGLAADEIAAIVVFTTGNPAQRLVKLNQWYRTLPEPEIDAASLTVVEDFDDYVVLHGSYQVPIVQQGVRPFDAPPAGKLVFDEDGKPVVQAQDTVPFLLTIPKAPMPAGGWPIMMYMHGSGGEMQELVDRGARTNADDPTSAPRGSGPGGVVAPYGIAGFAAEFGFHGTRFSPPDTMGLKLYNLMGNPRAAVDNFLVAANEVTLHARLLKAMRIDPASIPQLVGLVDVSQAADGLIRFDTERMSAMGQSMGSTIGLPALTISQDIDAGILSGSGATLIEVALTTTRPVELKPVLISLLNYRRNETMDRFDPVLNTLQHVWDFVDPSVHARHVYEAPHPDTPAKHVLQHSGVDDGYFSVYSRTALTGALNLDVATPLPEPKILEIMALVAPDHAQAVEPPVKGNLDGGRITGVATVYEPSVMDGHNVAYQLDTAKAQYACFAKSVGPDGPPTLRSVADSQVDTCP